MNARYISQDDLNIFLDLTPRQRRLVKLVDDEDWFPVFNDKPPLDGKAQGWSWPAWVRNNLFAAHLDYKQRYRTFLFLVGNGLAPTRATRLLTAIDYRDGKVIPGVYDASAWRHLRSMEKETADGKFLHPSRNHTRFFDINQGGYHFATGDN